MTNKERADIARQTMISFAKENSDPADMEAAIIDLLTNLRHFCMEEHIMFYKCAELSLYHYKNEQENL